MFYLGIDGGGTRTRCTLGDEAKVLATSNAGGCNVIRLGAAQAREALHAAVREVCEAAKIAPSQIASVCIGAAGAGRPEIVATVRGILAELIPGSIQVAGDMVIALHAAFGAGPGIIAIAGTGSIVYGRDAKGNLARAGGWGFAVSDEGSGYWIGRRAIHTILENHDLGWQTALTDLVLREWSLNSLDELIQAANASPPPEFPRLFPVVLRAAEAGDTAARSLLESAGGHLVRLTAMVLHRLLARPPYAPVAMTGSVFRQSADVRRVFYNALQTSFRGIEVRSELVEPVEGALALAREVGNTPAG